jgi:uncharacterized HhH-GPD family protein
VIGLVLDQQVQLDWAFKGPYLLSQRLGVEIDAAVLARMDPERLNAAFCATPALHRYPSSMATRVQAACQVVVDTYDGDASRIWSTAATGAELYKRLKALPGFGEMKARITVALLAKQLGVRPKGWRAAAGPFGEKGYRSIADITDEASLEKVRTTKQAMKAAHRAAAAQA